MPLLLFLGYEHNFLFIPSSTHVSTPQHCCAALRVESEAREKKYISALCFYEFEISAFLCLYISSAMYHIYALAGDKNI